MNNIFSKTIKAKLILLFLLISISTISAIGVLSYQMSSRALKKQLLNSLTSIAESREAAILGLLKFRLQHLEVLATNEVIQNLMQEWHKQEHGEKIDEMYLQERAKSFFDTELVEFNTITDFFEYMFIGENGKIYYSTDQSLIGADFSKDERFVKGMKKPFLTDVRFDSKLNRYFREIVVPVFPHQAVHEEVIIGVIVSRVGTEGLNEITTNREGLGETGEVYVVNKDGYMITESRFIKDAVLKQKVDTEPVRLFQSQKKVMTGIYRDYRNIPVAGVSMGDDLILEFPELGWTILAEVDASEFLIPIIKLRNIIIFAGLLIFVIVIFIAVIVSHTITTPIKRLTLSAQKISEGDFTASVQMKSIDEIGLLANAFNKMTDNLKKSFTSIDSLNMEIDIRRKVENALRDSEERFRTVIDNIAVGVSLISPKMEVLTVNNQMRKWFPRSGVEKSICHRVFCDPPREDKCPYCPTCRTLQDGQIYESAADICVDNKVINYRIVSYPVKDENGLVTAAVEMFEDISERRKIELAMQEAAEAKNKFTSMVSHELRTPLGPIKEGVSIILDGLTGEINAEQKDLLDTVRKNADRLNHLVNNVLDFQKLGSSRMQFNITENDMAEVINEVYDTMKLVTKQKGLELSVEVEQGLSKLKFDRDKITQVLINLVNNAVKFTEKGGIKIKARKGKNTLHVMIEDTGPGIKEEDIPKLFQTFSQLESGRERKTGGSGLGLAISKEIILHHKGKIWVESESGKGSIFQFILPIEERRG